MNDELSLAYLMYRWFFLQYKHVVTIYKNFAYILYFYNKSDRIFGKYVAAYRGAVGAVSREVGGSFAHVADLSVLGLDGKPLLGLVVFGYGVRSVGSAWALRVWEPPLCC